MFGKDRAPNKVYAKARKRFVRLPDVEILEWADLAGSAVSTSLWEFRKSKDPMLLAEAEHGIQQLHAAMDVLTERLPEDSGLLT